MIEEHTPFVDYYARLQVDPASDPRELELAFHRLAKLYHPDAGESADLDAFTIVTEAYRALKDPEKRQAYDTIYAAKVRAIPSHPTGLADSDLPDAASDAQLHARMLLLLYRRRRSEPADPGIPGWLLEETLGCSESLFEFHTWYLKAKNFIVTTEQGTIAITIEGVDHVIATAQAEESKKLLAAPSDRSD